ncbi:TetR/AcrR family transcriptional regulator [Mycobacterium avium subsp. hominissuis]|uniref:TetR family transcriptional regulator n=1 Tax=Mycobacterium palustre TaxID=153971 RepID=A0A1X1ZAW4_9MYCO|nr:MULTISPECIES: TetR family transcriptional regulator [Mycobacterium]BCO49777.1 TetR family transcriptional regulator [Mycobacterium paraintracellulare]ORW20499.1 TetR family transcriptional regulator [Mycobacterium palustre]QWY63540.1 TetR family transcriptional regulator [Mycobacterium avium subsp. hominissuis]BCO81872.1 TetR family transcriptional regulator [Mycobacterium paraintracellulare]BCO86966.1 TetR family transcriptional regulator [Mycobacterium paraintracellulare]
MARPKVALISRRKVLETALAIIDEDGLEGLSIRRLADALGVNGASLYHHFDNKDEILIGAAEFALSDVRAPEESDDHWRHWLPENARKLRAALLKHPALVPLIVGKRSLGMGARMLDTSAQRLVEEGVPGAAVMPLLDALELFAIGSALHETQGYTPESRHDIDADQYPALAKALSERGLSFDEIYDLVTNSILDAIDTAVKERQARWLPAAELGKRA